jgi:hypothetical protein
MEEGEDCVRWLGDVEYIIGKGVGWGGCDN